MNVPHIYEQLGENRDEANALLYHLTGAEENGCDPSHRPWQMVAQRMKEVFPSGMLDELATFLGLQASGSTPATADPFSPPMIAP